MQLDGKIAVIAMAVLVVAVSRLDAQTAALTCTGRVFANDDVALRHPAPLTIRITINYGSKTANGYPAKIDENAVQWTQVDQYGSETFLWFDRNSRQLIYNFYASSASATDASGTLACN